MKRQRFLLWMVASIFAVAGFANSSHAQLALRLEADNFNPLTGVWSDSSGLNNHATQATLAARPTLVGNRTANGSAVLRFDGFDDELSLTSPISPTSAADGYTAIAYLRPNGGSTGSIVAGALDSFQYRIVAAGQQQTLEANIGSPSTGAGILPQGETAAFSSINTRANNAAVLGGFRLNGAADGNTVSNTFSSPITGIGRKFVGGTERYVGDIAEIRIYNTQLTVPQLQAIEAELTAAYQAPTGQLALPVILNPTFDTDANLFSTAPGYVGGSNPTEIPSWTGSGPGNRGINGTGGGNAFANNGKNGSPVAFLQGEGAISNTISGFEVGEEYRIAFEYNARSGNRPPAGITATIGTASFTDGVVPAVGGSNAYYSGNLVFTAANPMETLTINSLDIAGDDALLVDNFRVFRNGPAIGSNGFEDATLADNNFKKDSGAGTGDLSTSSWTISDGGGVTRNVSGFQNGIRGPEGEQHGLIQGTGSFEQTINGFEDGAGYSLSLLTMARQGQDFGNDLEVILDAGLSSEIVLFDIAEVTFDSFTEIESALFLAEKDEYELTIRASLDGGNLSGDRTTFFDNVWFNQLTAAPAVVPEPASIAIWTLIGLGLVGFGYYRARRNK